MCIYFLFNVRVGIGCIFTIVGLIYIYMLLYISSPIDMCPHPDHSHNLNFNWARDVFTKMLSHLNYDRQGHFTDLLEKYFLSHHFLNVSPKYLKCTCE